ncbi:alginate export family protein [Gaopeijia maritima]|uniref:Alginate export family protein n=1 Tax=Gaopeijia maritima TaxID=3119007 RepID=A0ABU9E6R3_9BACT
MKRRGWWAAAAGCLLLATPFAASAQSWSAQVRPRFETRIIDGDTDSFTAMRTRVGVEWAFDLPGTLFVQLQDVRRWGTAPGDGSADLFDLHQGWVEFGHRGVSPVWIRAGRQEMNFGTRRLIAAPPWSHVSRSFDAGRAALRVSERTTFDVFFAQIAEERSFSGLWLETSNERMERGAAYALLQNDGASDGRRQTTLGAEALVRFGPARLQLEGALQTTEGVSDGAWFGAVRYTVPLAREGGLVSAGVDALSGAAPDADRRPFDRLYGLAHTYYGYADIFSDLDGSTGGRGLVDWIARGVWPLPDGWSLQLDLHHFRVAEGADLESAHLGNELDLSTRWQNGEGVSVLGGLSLFDDGEGRAELGQPDLGQIFGYLQVDVALQGR